jgi:tetratricopeptide repeat protein
MIRRWVLLVALLLIGTSVAADEQAELARAQSLAWSKQFGEAARLYASILRRHPGSRDATVGLAQVRLWQGHYRQARKLFLEFPRDAEAAEGAATAAYWSGDYRTAEREYRALLAKHPGRENARRSLSELRAASATTERIDVGVVDDDQPFRATRSEAGVSMFTDPLTRWDATVGTYRLSSDVTRGGAPFLIARNETVFPAAKLTVTSSLGGIRTPNHQSHVLGGLATRYRLFAHDTLTAGFTRREITTTATRLFPFVDVMSLRWQHESPWLASIGAERDRFSDRNSAHAFDGYVLYPIRKMGKWTFWTGASALARDTSQSRFYVTQINARRDPTGRFFLYTYRGAYDPYWTPLGLREARLIVGVERRIGSGTTMKVQVDGGAAHDRAITFWPDAGPDSFPAQIGTSTFPRTYGPWRVRLSTTTPLVSGLSLDLGFEHSTTVYYRANSFHASLARRR